MPQKMLKTVEVHTQDALELGLDTRSLLFWVMVRRERWRPVEARGGWLPVQMLARWLQ